MLRIIIEAGQVVGSLLLGAFLLAFVALNFPATFELMIGWATGLKAAITNTGLDPKYNNWIRLLLEERQLLFMFFTVLARVIIALPGNIVSWIIGRSSR